MNKEKFLIQKLHIKNFRGYSDQKFVFFENPNETGIILLGGSNGYGKTSLLDSIEWCLTGKIQRIKNTIKQRNSGDNSLNRNHDKGLIRNTNCNDDEAVTVILEALYGNKQCHFIREFNNINGLKEEDALNPDNSTFVVKILDENGDIIINENNSKSIDDFSFFGSLDLINSFYKRHLCSFEKNINLYNTGRKDFAELLKSFFDNEEIEIIKNNLKNIKDKLRNNIDNIAQEIKEKNEELIKLENEQLKIKEISDYKEFISTYDKQKFYLKELMPEEIENEEENIKEALIQSQIASLEKILIINKFKKEYNLSKKYLDYLEKKSICRRFEENILHYFFDDEMYKNILNAQENEEKGINFYLEAKSFKNHLENIKTELNQINFKDTNKLDECANLVLEEFYKLIKLIFDIKDDSNSLSGTEEEIFDEVISEWELEEELSLIEAKIIEYRDYSKEGIEIEALRSIQKNIEAFKLYIQNKGENGKANCPLCGTKEALTIENIGKTALDALDQNSKKKTEIEQIIINNLEIILNESNRILDSHISNTNETITGIELARAKTEKIKYSCLDFGLDFNRVDRDIIQNKYNELKSNISDPNVEAELFSSFNEKIDFISEHIENPIIKGKLLISQDYQEWEESFKKNLIKNFINQYENELIHYKKIVSDEIKSYESEFINCETIANKINILKFMKDYIISTRNLSLMRDLEQNKNNIETQFSKIDNYFNKIREFDNIYIGKLFEKINTPFINIYRRINRHTNFDISLSWDSRRTALASCSTDKECYISNVLSAGQISTVAISLFLLVALSQKDKGFRCYFMDDPIQSIDDLNILSFVDLIKTEFLNKEDSIMDQLFIAVCNEDFEKLIYHKMKTFDVNIKYINFTGYGKYKEGS